MNKYTMSFVWSGSIMTISFLAIINLLTSRNYPWFVYPSFCILCIPLILHYLFKRDIRAFSIMGGLLLSSFFILSNYLFSPSHPWFWYAVFPALLWPIIVCMGKKTALIGYAVIGCISIILYYSTLNIVLSPGYPWAIYPAYVAIWWPSTLYFIKRKQYFGFSIFGALLTILFFTIVNICSSPDEIWAVYPAFAILWWPLSYYYFKVKSKSND